MTHRQLKGACLVAATIAVPATALGTNAAAATKKVPVITISGSTSVAPLANKLARRYHQQYPHRVKFKLAQGGSDVGVADVAKGRVSIGTSSRDAKDSDPSGLVFNKIARDAICVVTNPANALANVSQATVQDIFSGKVRDWSDVPGASISGPIDITVRTPASGTQDAFQKLFMGASVIADSAAQKGSNGLVQQAVKDDKQAVGYVSLPFAAGLNSTSYKGTPCTLQDAKSGAYQGTRNFWMVTRGAPTGAVKTWIAWIQSSKNATKVISTEWVPVL
ncbi:MAG: phosphate transport system substrate-binding protein [Solirubrobacteraceae bacterium]|nr:phosphate transport system substrate-binding protein [Solirubrobacteraceae bacterium]